MVEPCRNHGVLLAATMLFTIDSMVGTKHLRLAQTHRQQTSIFWVQKRPICLQPDLYCTDSQDFDISTTYSKVVKSRPILDMLAINTGQQNCVVYRTMVGDLFCSRVK